ncbi:MAG: SDR family NAD(P)-dependent oxidoreductase [Pontixanthobacter sp.]
MTVNPPNRPPRNAIIFGASGAIGKAVCDQLTKDGCAVWAGSRSGDYTPNDIARPFAFDLTDEASIERVADEMKGRPIDLIVAATGVLTLDNGQGPERTYKRMSADFMAETFALNTIGPAMIAKHMLPLLPRDERSVFAALTARVGSIGDNGLGGWHSYRASKAALNMLLKNFAIELRRTHKQAIVAGLHPGTVDSKLSEPFQNNLPEGQLTKPMDAAASLLAVLNGLTPENSGTVFDFAGKPIEP